MINLKKFIIVSLLIFTIFAPSLSFAKDPVSENGGLVPCGTEKSELVTSEDPVTHKITQTGGEIKVPCTFDHILVLINNIINFLLFVIAIPIAAVMFCYAGFLMIFSGGEASARTKAKGIFWNVVFGLVIAAGAWAIMHTLLGIIGVKKGDGYNWFGLFN